MWRCKCDCGGEKVTRTETLRMGATKSCGCLQRETAIITGKKTSIHGMKHSPEYRVWRTMKQRCNNPNAANYHLYGGRGVNVCKRWKDSFKTFYSDLGPRPSKKYSLDRTDPDGNYEPGNCRWATTKDQLANRRTFVEMTNEDMNLAVLHLLELLYSDLPRRELILVASKIIAEV